MYVYWLPPRTRNQNTYIESYTVSVYEVDTNETWNETIHRSLYKAAPLHPYYHYRIQVSALTNVLGPPAIQYVQALEDGKLHRGAHTLYVVVSLVLVLVTTLLPAIF